MTTVPTTDVTAWLNDLDEIMSVPPGDEPWVQTSAPSLRGPLPQMVAVNDTAALILAAGKVVDTNTTIEQSVWLSITAALVAIEQGQPEDLPQLAILDALDYVERWRSPHSDVSEWYVGFYGLRDRLVGRYFGSPDREPNPINPTFWT